MPLTLQARNGTGDHMFLNSNDANYGDATGLLASAVAGSTQLSLASVAYVAADTLMTADELSYTGYVDQHRFELLVVGPQWMVQLRMLLLFSLVRCQPVVL